MGPRDLAGGSVAKTSHSQCRGSRLDPWSGNYIPHAATEVRPGAAEVEKEGHSNGCEVVSPVFFFFLTMPRVLFGASLGAAQMIKNLPAMWETWV